MTAKTNDITVTRPINQTSTVQIEPIEPVKPCCPGLWIEAAILILIVVIGLFGFINAVKAEAEKDIK